MRSLRQLCALQSLLSSSTSSLAARSPASADTTINGKLHATVTAILPTLGFAVAAAKKTYATDTRDADSGMDARRQSGSAAGTSVSSEDQSAESEDWMNEWGKALEKNDLAAQAEILQKTFGEDPEPVGPPLHELLNYNRKEEERAKRRLYELQKQEEIRQSRYSLSATYNGLLFLLLLGTVSMLHCRVRIVDDFGRAYGTGKRKTSIARIWLAAGIGEIRINNRSLNEYFPLFERRADVLAPFCTTNTHGLFDVRATVKGGGNTGQAQALRHGISKALQLFEPDLRPALKVEGLLTRDSRIVERKKPGKAKARKSFQWVKR